MKYYKSGYWWNTWKPNWIRYIGALIFVLIWVLIAMAHPFG